MRDVQKRPVCPLSVPRQPADRRAGVCRPGVSRAGDPAGTSAAARQPARQADRPVASLAGLESMLCRSLHVPRCLDLGPGWWGAAGGPPAGAFLARLPGPPSSEGPGQRGVALRHGSLARSLPALRPLSGGSGVQCPGSLPGSGPSLLARGGEGAGQLAQTRRALPFKNRQKSTTVRT